MGGCPYTWFKGLFGGKAPSDAAHASHLRVTVTRGGDKTVDVSLPARSARWLIDLIPDDVVEKIRSEGIPLEDIQADLAARADDGLVPQKIFTLEESQRTVTVWLE